MPHLVIQYSKNLGEQVNMTDFCIAMSKALGSAAFTAAIIFSSAVSATGGNFGGFRGTGGGSLGA